MNQSGCSTNSQVVWPKLVDHYKDQLRFGSVALSQYDGRYVCESVNLIRNEDSTRLQHSLEAIARMSRDEIKHYYKSSLRAESPEWSKGANIGLLTLSRDVSEPLEFTFASVESSMHSTFYLKAII
ncbi:MAG: hypothetical protein XXXJIFNMEKO3_02742 [Candidatus Erwinia impunctatus]|nr:hypothetical protein XXXJIFNMEKO_02742 [Culicoides impunctatus]